MVRAFRAQIAEAEAVLCWEVPPDAVIEDQRCCIAKHVSWQRELLALLESMISEARGLTAQCDAGLLSAALTAFEAERDEIKILLGATLSLHFRLLRCRRRPGWQLGAQTTANGSKQ